MKKYYLFASLVLLAASPGFAQTKIGAAGAPDASAMLEVTSGAANNKGLLLPKLTTVQRDAITAPANALMIYNTTAGEVQVNTGTPVAPIWTTATAGNSGWNTIGNIGTNPATNFLGTNDNQALVLRTNNTEQARITETGSVGIGTGTPLAKLEVVDTGNAAMQVRTSTDGRMSFQLGNANHGIIRNLIGSGGGGNDVALYTSNGGGGADLYLINNPISNGSDSLPLNQFVLKSITGNVGIGTNAPAQRLHVEGTARIATAAGTPTSITGRNADGDVGEVALGSGLALTGGTLSVTGSINNWSLAGNSGTNPATDFIGTSDSQPLVIRTNNTERMQVFTDGSIGINTSTSNGATLAVNTDTVTSSAVSLSLRDTVRYFMVPEVGFSGAFNTLTNNGDAGIFFPGITGTEIAAGAATTRGFVIAPHTNIGNGPAGLKITEQGKVGIGNATPESALHISNGGATISNGTTPITSPVITIINDGAGNTLNDDVNIYSYGDVTSPGFSVFTARGTAAAPLNAQPGDNMGAYVAGAQFNGTITALNMISSDYVGGGLTPKSRMHFATSGVTNTVMTIDSSSYVGIGTTTPKEKLEVAGAGNVAVQVLTTSSGHMSFQLGNANHGIIRNLATSGGGGNDVALYTSNGGGGADLYLIANSVSNGADSLPLDQFVLKNSGNVGIGTNAPTAKLSVNGDANNTTGTWTIFSDARVKTVDDAYEDGLASVLKIRPVKFHYNANAPFKSTEQQIGIIAQEMEQIAPYMVTKVKAEGFTDLRQYNNQALPYMLVNAIQEQQAQIEALKAKNEQLEAANKVTAQLMERVKQMEQMMGINEIEGTSKVAGK